ASKSILLREYRNSLAVSYPANRFYSATLAASSSCVMSNLRLKQSGKKRPTRISHQNPEGVGLLFQSLSIFFDVVANGHHVCIDKRSGAVAIKSHGSSSLRSPYTIIPVEIVNN